MEEQTTFLWTTILPFLWFLGLPLTVNLYWLRVKELNFSYLAFLILGSYFMVLYLQGEEWIAYASIPIILLFYFADRRFSLYYDFLRYNLNREKSYKKEKKQSRWKSWKKENEEDRIYEEAKKKWEEDNKKRSNSDYESKREQTYPKDESQDFGREDKKDNEVWKDVYKKKNIENMTRGELRKAFLIGTYQEWKTATDEEKKWIEEVKDELSKRKRNRSFTNPNY